MLKHLKFEYKITLIYLLIGLLWILLSDRIINQLVDDKDLITQISIVKGFFYVGITALLLFYLIRRNTKKIIDYQEQTINNEQKYRLLYEYAGVGIGYYDLEGKVISYNPIALQLMGGNSEDFVGKSIYELFPKDLADEYSSRMKKSITANQPQKYEDYVELPTGGKWFISAYSKIINNEGQPIGVQIISSEITQQKTIEIELLKAKEKAEENERKYRTIVENITDALYIHDFEGRIIDCNEAALIMTGYSRDELIGNTLSIIDSEENKLMLPERMQRLMADNMILFEGTHIRKDKSIVPVEVSGKVVSREGAGIIHGFVRDITERKNTEEELQIKNKAIESSINAMAIADLEGKLTYVNPAFLSLWGYKDNQEVLGRSSIEFWQITEEPMAVIKAIQNQGFWKGEMVAKRSDGSIFDSEVSASMIKDNNGSPLCLHASFIDITERKRAEEDLIKAKERAEESERELIASQKVARVGYYILDVTKGLWTSSEMLDDFFGIDRNYERSVEGWNAIVYEEDRQMMLDYFVNDVIGKRQNFDKQYRIINQKDKQMYWVHGLGSLEFDGHGNPTRMFGTIQDITTIKKYELSLVEAKEKAEESEKRIQAQNQEILFNNERLESLLKVSKLQTDSIQEVLDFALTQAVELTKSQIGYIYFYNEEKKQFILNTWSKEVMKECMVMEPQTIYDLDCTGWWGEAVRQRKPIIINDYTAENSLTRGTPEGHVRLNNFLTIPVILDNKIVAVTGVANKPTDYNDSDVRQLTLLMDNVWKISERISLIEDLKAAKEKAEESDNLKTAFLQNISHEIRTPLNGILGFSSLMEDKDNTYEDIKEYTSIIKKSGNRLLEIVNNILDISRIETGQLKISNSTFSINSAILDLISFFDAEAQSKGIQLKYNFTLTEDLSLISTDYHKFFQVLTNLVKNAIKFTTEGSINVGYELQGSNYLFYVNDTGSGIPKEIGNKIFERFVQADHSLTRGYEGAGLGLAISKGLVELLGGNIWYESAVGIGTTFNFTLPSNIHVNLEEHNEEQPIKYISEKVNILIAEDDEDSYLFLSTILKNDNNNIIHSKTGPHALELFIQNPKIDIIFMDIQLPGMNGYDVTKNIREISKDVIIIAQTAYAQSSDREKALAIGCNEYISKPYKREAIRKLVLESLSKRRKQGANKSES